MDDFKTDQAIDEIDKQIDAWEEYKKKWDDISKNFESSLNHITALQVLGNDMDAKVLAQRLDIYQQFYNGYVNILKQINDSTTKFSNNQVQALGLLQSTTPTYHITTSSTSVRGANFNASGNPYIGKEGLSKVDEHGNELIVRKPAQGRYTFLQHGDGILNARLTRNIMALANNPDLAIRNVLGNIIANGSKGINNAQSQVINISNITLPNVDNASQFVKQLQLISQNH